MSRDPRVPRLDGELEQLLSEQMEMLANRCDAFYNGKVHEAKSAAGILSALLCERGQQSLLEQLGFKDKYMFLDSRHRNCLCRNTARGSWPVTPWPFNKAYRESDLVCFDDWWSQKFRLWYSDIIVSRQELVSLIRNKEYSHIDPFTVDKIAAVRRSRSGWQRQIKENEDESTTMTVILDVTRQPVPDNSDFEEISDYELASVIAIAEEVLFSLTPEPKNRLRMQIEMYQKPLYLTQEESNRAKNVLRADLTEIERLAEDFRDSTAIIVARRMLQHVLDMDLLTTENYDVRESVSAELNRERIPWHRENEIPVL